MQCAESTQIERLANRGGQVRFFRFANLFGVIRHPKKEVCLFDTVDTGYSSHFVSCTQHFPELLYRKLVPVSFSNEESAVAQVDITFIIAPLKLYSNVLHHVLFSHSAAQL